MLTELTAKAAETRALWQRAKFIWGETDCILATCDHVLRVTGIDPAAPWRGTYNEGSAKAVMAPYGGVLGIMRHGMRAAGFLEGEPHDGAPVVCDLHGYEVAGVVFGKRVGFMAERGLVEARTPILAAWVI